MTLWPLLVGTHMFFEKCFAGTCVGPRFLVSLEKLIRIGPHRTAEDLKGQFSLGLSC